MQLLQEHFLVRQQITRLLIQPVHSKLHMLQTFGSVSFLKERKCSLEQAFGVVGVLPLSPGELLLAGASEARTGRGLGCARGVQRTTFSEDSLVFSI